MRHISNFYKEDANPKHRAEIINENDVYKIHYYNIHGELFKTESFEGKSWNYVRDAAENWASGIKVLNG